MKKLMVLMMALILTLSLTACSEEITLQSQTVYDLTLDVPSDFGEFSDATELIKMAKAEDSSGSIAISQSMDAQGVTADLWDEETLIANVLGTIGDLEILEFSNTDTAAGRNAVYAKYTGTSNGDIKVIGYNYLLYAEDGTYQSIAFNYVEGSDSSLEKNITTILNSMK